ncbi:type VI secretion lipoprotein TssJ, partial [Burkholderia ambifaria]|uniref:type VI secretion lipoprotein TssJ n=1 Tax=Burkholderia ambifaria TaxID=152480 RepID=UPI001FC7CA20
MPDHAARVAACGRARTHSRDTGDAAKWAFTTQVKTMNLDLVARSSLNANAAGQPLSTVARLYQLKDAKTF